MNPVPLRWPLTLLVLLATLLSSSRSAWAICGRLPGAAVLPSRRAPAPLNTHVFVTLAAATDGRCAEGVPAEVCANASWDLELRTAPARGAPAHRLTTTKTSFVAGLDEHFELVPEQRLAARTGHEVWLVDRTHAVAPRILGAFVTGDAADQEVPKGASLFQAILLRLARGMVLLDGECGSTKLTLFLSGTPSDDATPPAQLLAAIWIAKPGAKIDYSRPPTTLQRIDVGPLLPHPTILAGNTYYDDLPSVDGSQPIKVGLRLIDLAGNRSEPTEMVSN